VYLQSQTQLTTNKYKQQHDELIQQKIKLEDDIKWLNFTNKQLTDDNEQLKLTSKQLYNENRQLKILNKQLDDDCKHLKSMNKQLNDDNKLLKTSNKQLGEQLKSDNVSYEHVAPVILKMNNFTEKKTNNQLWWSDQFFAFWRGYKMCLRVDANGYGEGEGTHISVSLLLMKGPYDDELEQIGCWPMRGRFKVELLSQSNDNKYTHFIYDRDTPSNVTGRVIEGDKAPSGWGHHQFIPHKTILDSDHLKHDSLYFMISYQNSSTLKETKDTPYEQLTPVILKMHDFTEKMNNKIRWYSDPFFAFWKGYKMCFMVDASGHGSVTDHVSVYLYLMKGPYDDKLEQSGHWPLRGTFKIELLDQINNDNHTHYIPFDGIVSSNHTNRVIVQDMAPTGWGNPQFISHKTILNGNYIKHDSLYFMISYQPNSASKLSNVFCLMIILQLAVHVMLI